MRANGKYLFEDEGKRSAEESGLGYFVVGEKRSNWSEIRTQPGAHDGRYCRDGNRREQSPREEEIGQYLS